MRNKLQSLTQAQQQKSVEHPKFDRFVKSIARDAWEVDLNKQFLRPTLHKDKIQAATEAAGKKFAAANDEGKTEINNTFVRQVLETGASEEKNDTRVASMSALWRYRYPFSYEDFCVQFKMNEGNIVDYGILNSFISSEAKLTSLQYLPDVLGWQALLLAGSNRCISEEQAQHKSCGKFIEEQSDKVMARKMFEGFQAAWNHSWQFVLSYGCLKIPSIYHDLKIDEHTPIVFCLPREKNEGICGLSLVQYLVQMHNSFVETINDVIERRQLKGQQSHAAVVNVDAKEAKSVASRFFTRAHTVVFDLNGEFLPYVEKQCVQYDATTGEAVYSFQAAEQYLIDVYFTGKPLIDLNIRTILYLGGTDSAQSSLQFKVDQEKLTKDQETRVLDSLDSKSAGRKCLEQLQTCISFLGASSSYEIGDWKLGTYAKDVLLLAGDHLFGSSYVAESLCLKHADSLRTLLTEFVIVDPFEKVGAAYKRELDPLLSSRAQESLQELEPEAIHELITGLRMYCVQVLSDSDGPSADASLKENLGFIQTDETLLQQNHWYVEHFPESLQVGHAVTCYNLLRTMI
jgi:hypothetical protein